jgi:pimeloyl-ACP methyl ester carboxylesterase
MRYAEPATAEFEGARAFSQFCTPALSRHRTPDHEQLVVRARYHLRSAEVRRVVTSVGEVQIYVFAPRAAEKAAVLLVHGWTGESAFMGAFAERLRRAGYRAILMDMPAHGCSEGTTATLFDCSRAILDVAVTIAPVRFALGHSIGAMALLTVGEGRYPLPRNYPFEAYVLVSMPDAFADVTRSFGDELSLTPAALRAFERRLEELAGRRITEFSGTTLLAATQRSSLLLHARDDNEVSFKCAERMWSSTPKAGLRAFDGLGHRAILYAAPVMRCAVQFFDAQLADSC